MRHNFKKTLPIKENDIVVNVDDKYSLYRVLKVNDIWNKEVEILISPLQKDDFVPYWRLAKFYEPLNEIEKLLYAP